MSKVSSAFFESFQIIESEASGRFSLLLPPDFALCACCRQELHSPDSRRFGYPFITCTYCGPRYSIITALPFDRPNTTMAAFEQCEACLGEYTDPTDRRFHAQTNSCTDCGPTLGWYKSNGEAVVKQSVLHDPTWILKRAKWALEAGKILAVKGIGGYLLLCDATESRTVERLRLRKHRPTKPFAILYPSLETLQEEVRISEKEVKELQSVASPIVLAERRPNCQVVEAVAPHLSQLGVMLPYAPLLELLALDFGKPLVATSGNVSGNPIVYEDQKAITDLASIADYILTHNRPIVVPQDDSVVRFTPKHQQKIILRRSRGLPLHLPKPFSCSEEMLAVGASMKATFTLNTQDYLYVSQYLGDSESYETQENYKQVVAHFLSLQSPALADPMTQISAIFCDAHEGYFSTQWAEELSQSYDIPVHKIQHHQAHLAAVVAENDLLASTEPLLGVIWDGTGYGHDGQIWGGEFYVFSEENSPISNQLLQPFNRLHFTYFDALLGDKMPREPRLSALSFCSGLANSERLVRSKFTSSEWGLYQKALKNNSLKTSSVGRIFDAVASLVGGIDKVSYEGEAALLLEELAGGYFKKYGYTLSEWYLHDIEFRGTIPTHQLAAELVADLINGELPDRVAAKFHLSLVKIIEKIAKYHGIKRLAFSGGVFQNSVLVDLLLEHLGKEFTLFFHRQLCPNDENISYGQMVLGSLIK
jgi:hydrogenase maturation protein HypF